MDNRILNYDVCVIGGGPAGCMAAIAAARNGAKTLIVERTGALGGMLTTGGVGPMMSFHAGNTQVVRGLADELIRRMKERHLSPGHMEDFVGFADSVTPFDAEGMKLILEEMLLEAGCVILYHTVYTGCKKEGDRITNVQLYAKCGFMETEAKVFIDCSADADLAVHAGVDCFYGDERNGNIPQPMTMNVKVTGVNRDAVIRYVKENREDMLSTIPFDHLEQIPRTGIQGGSRLVAKAKAAGDLHISKRGILCFETNNCGEFILNNNHICDYSALDPFELTRAVIQGRKEAFEVAQFAKKYIPGFENCTIVSIGPDIGIRESRRIKGACVVTAEDLVNNTMFEDAIGMGGYPVDVHTKYNDYPCEKYTLKKGSWYSIPYRCLITDELSNLLVAGRCVSTDHTACGAYRVTPNVMTIGQAAGTAAALTARTAGDVRAVDIPKLQAQLEKDGVFLRRYVKTEENI